MLNKPQNNNASVGSMMSTAIVTNNQDPDNLGRIKVRYPWQEETEESYWARISTFMAGDQRGAFFIPEVEEEVLVAFMNADIGFPVIIGSLWSQSDTPPHDNSDGKNNIRKIHSRSGHQIIFDDNEEDSTAKLELISASGHKIILDDTEGSQKICIEDNAGGLIELDAVNNKISIKSSMDISIEATNISINATAELTLNGSLIRIN